MGSTTFNAGSNANWHDGSNWTNGVPTSGDFATIDADCVIDNTAGECIQLTITSGSELDCNDQDLTVIRATFITGSLLCKSGEMSFRKADISGTAATWAVTIAAAGVYDGGTGLHTIGSLSLSSGEMKLTTGITDFNGTDGGHPYSALIYAGSNFDPNGGTVRFSGPIAKCYIEKDLHNVEFSGATGNGIRLERFGQVSGTLNVIGGEFIAESYGNNIGVTGITTISSGSTFTLASGTSGVPNFTGTDYISNVGTFNMSSSSVTAGGFLTRTGGVTNLTTDVLTLTEESGSYVMTDDGTYHHNSGTVHIDWNTGGTDGTTVLDMNTSHLYNLIIEMNSSSYETKWYNKLQVDNDLTINRGVCRADTSSPVSATISGSLIIDNEGTFGATGTTETITMGNLNMMSGSALVLASGTTTVTNNGSNATGRTWFTRTNGSNPGPRTLTVPSGSMLMLPGGGTIEFDNSNYFYNITCSGTFSTKNSSLNIDNDFRCNGWSPNGNTGYHFTVGNDFTKIGSSTFNSIDTGSNWTVSGNMIIESGNIDVHGRSATTPGDVNLKLYGNFINKGGEII